MSDQQITCSECQGAFVFTEAEQDFYASKGLAAPPKRCKTCRQARKAAKEGGGGGGFGRAPRFGNGGGDFRGPAGAPRGDGPRPPRAGFRSGPPGRGPARGFGGGDARGGNGEYRAPSFARGDGPRADAPRGDAPRGDAPRGEGRPAFPRSDSRGGFGGDSRGGFGRSDSRGGFGGGDARGGFGRSDSRSNDRPRGGDSVPRTRDARGPQEWGSNTAPREQANGDAHAPREARAPRQRPERPKYDITCGTCGAQAQVPFKPLEGRQVFCQACYRARKGTATPEQVELTPAVTPDTDAGIVE